MKTIIKGKNLKTTYGVNNNTKEIKDENGALKIVYTAKPELTKVVDTTWETIAEFDEDIEFNKNQAAKFFMTGIFNSIGTINITEDEEVSVIKKKFIIDQKAYVLYTDKVLDSTEELKEISEENLCYELESFNRMMIESNEKLLAYCNLHKLILKETDVDELMKLVYPDQQYYIEDGKIMVKNYSYTNGLSKADRDEIMSSVNNLNPYITLKNRIK
jgi:hypothetical protein